MKLRRMDIIDKMAKTNTALVVFTLALLFLFIAYAGDWFSIKSSFTTTHFYQNLLLSTWIKYIPLLIVFIPMFGAVIEAVVAKTSIDHRDKSVIYLGLLTLIIVVFIYPLALEDLIRLEIPNILLLGMSFRIDMLSYSVLLLSSFIWFFVMIYAHEYMKKEEKSTRFFFFLSLTYGSVLGAIMSGDLLTMFLFFEIMTIVSYMLVIHGQNDASYKAGYNYIIMGLIGGFLILTALLLIYFNIGDLHFESAIDAFSQLGNLKYWVMGLLVFGFGIKAGMAPVHVWLPRAHPVAPTPASALLSGVMIKVGAFGIIRTASSYYFPSKETITSVTDPIWITAENIGAIIIWTGIITMALGVFLALQQENMKKMLAYHSVSQMGYIVTGIGVALYLGYQGAMGYTGALYHIINHALFKSLLFMIAGVIYFHTKELNMYKLGGLWKKLPFTTIVFVVAALGISGFPLFNGYVSKTILHHGLTEAYHYGHSSFVYAEIIFIIVSAGTVCSFIKMGYYVFFKKSNNDYKSIPFDYSSHDIALWAMAFIIILIGVFPKFIIYQLIVPQLYMTTYDPDFIHHYILELNVFEIKDLLTTFGIVAFGFVIFFVGKKFNLFHLHLPKWMSVEYIFFLPAYLIMKNLCRLLYGDKCPYNEDDFKKLSEEDIEKVGFIDRFVITSNVLNRRYESSMIRGDAFIYTLSLVLVFALMLIFL
ncbi:proton-conducting membrane transporter [Hujiaoplasma nucleasis]|uniref:Proton-conducting membrane transporter n=1 Tax=Hujiaoplasma nucleasis TaxID=2725268 RepID=A0A7L6N3U8_9MOLU|nr:proton-conducting transporter membrane subunit [Hujiaoplasma nucleasis]QLY40221.1 proton-conducting membrane transporter [Hujiaoplasma nucleasis]